MTTFKFDESFEGGYIPFYLGRFVLGKGEYVVRWFLDKDGVHMAVSSEALEKFIHTWTLQDETVPLGFDTPAPVQYSVMEK